jgi:predicted nucleic acid-binding protein
MVVLDTNVVLALYWFQDARLGRLAQALQTGQLQWLATSEMRQELVHVLERWQGDNAASGPSSGLPEEGPGIQDVLRMFDRLAEQVTASPAGPTPRCTDSADQKFIDLALISRSSWLLSRDQAQTQAPGDRGMHGATPGGLAGVMRREARSRATQATRAA